MIFFFEFQAFQIEVPCTAEGTGAMKEQNRYSSQGAVQDRKQRQMIIQIAQIKKWLKLTVGYPKDENSSESHVSVADPTVPWQATVPFYPATFVIRSAFNQVERRKKSKIEKPIGVYGVGSDNKEHVRARQ